MLNIRVIPTLLYKNGGLVKTTAFKSPNYIGDPINAIKIFNDKRVDELVFLDISATLEKREPNYKVISEIASECFMPLSYGGGIQSISQIREILRLGVEKVILNTAAVNNPNFIKEASAIFGSSTIIVSIDYKRNFFGKTRIYTDAGRKATNRHPVEFAKEITELGAGELMINSIERDGAMEGYDIEMLHKLTREISVPVIAIGGAGKVDHMIDVIKKTNIAAVAAGSIFVYHGPHKAVLINYVDIDVFKKKLKDEK